MLVATYAEETELQDLNLRAAFVIARLAVLRAALAAYLSLDHAWALALPEARTIFGNLDWDLSYASTLVPDQPDLPQLIRRNLGELIERYRCEWLPIDERTSPPGDSGHNESQVQDRKLDSTVDYADPKDTRRSP